MRLLISDILPLSKQDGQETVLEYFNSQFENADRVEIAVGYTSAASLEELDRLVKQLNISSVCLTIGMYYVEGMPERAYHIASKISKRWESAGIGEIRIVKTFKYHGKAFCFYKNGIPISTIVGSANLGVIKPEASNRRQYELAIASEDLSFAAEVDSHIKALKAPNISSNILEIENMTLVREINTALNGVELVRPILDQNVAFYEECPAEVSFYLKLKVPSEADRFLDDGKHFTKSNINVCYAKPRSSRKARDWFETQITVGADIYRMPGYPKKNHPFFVITDDGYCFKAHTTSDNNKQFSAVGDELIMGRWLKGRLAAAGIVTPVNNTALDTEREGMITKEMLREYGCDRLYFKKTGQTSLDENGNSLDVWMLSFIGDGDK